MLSFCCRVQSRHLLLVNTTTIDDNNNSLDEFKYWELMAWNINCFTDTPTIYVFATGLLSCGAIEQISAKQSVPIAEAVVDQRGFRLTDRSRWTTAQSFPNDRPRHRRVDVSSFQSLVDIDQSSSNGHDGSCPDGLVSVVP